MTNIEVHVLPNASTDGHVYRYKALHSNVLAVASVNTIVGDWSAYVAPVPGESHSDEMMDVARHGEKLASEVAAALFPDFAKNYRWRG